MAPSARILVLYGNSLYAQAIETLLKKREDLDVTGLDLEKDEILRHVASVHPEAIIVDCNDLKTCGNSLILQVLNESPETRVLCISPNLNSVDVYRKSRVEVTAADELVHAITGG